MRLLITTLTNPDHSNVIDSAVTMSDARRSWFAMSMQMPAFFLVKLCRAARKLTQAQRPGHGIDVLAIETKAMAAVQESLDKNNLSDGIVSAIAGIVCYEVSRLKGASM